MPVKAGGHLQLAPVQQVLPQATQPGHRSAPITEQSRRIYTEEKAKVVAAVLGTEFIQFVAALVILHKDYMKKRMNCTRMI